MTKKIVLSYIDIKNNGYHLRKQNPKLQFVHQRQNVFFLLITIMRSYFKRFQALN